MSSNPPSGSPKARSLALYVLMIAFQHVYQAEEARGWDESSGRRSAGLGRILDRLTPAGAALQDGLGVRGVGAVVFW